MKSLHMFFLKFLLKIRFDFSLPNIPQSHVKAPMGAKIGTHNFQGVGLLRNIAYKKEKT